MRLKIVLLSFLALILAGCGETQEEVAAAPEVPIVTDVDTTTADYFVNEVGDVCSSASTAPT